MEKDPIKKHTLTLAGEARITGVTQVLSLEEKEVKVAIGDRTLLLTGEGFNAENLSLDEGTLLLSGEVASVKYLTHGQSKGLLKRIFK